MDSADSSGQSDDVHASLNRWGRVDFAGIVKNVNLAYCPQAKVGDYAIVHVGFAISLLDEEEAHKVFAYLKQMEDMKELNLVSPQPIVPPAGAGEGI